MGDLRDDIEKYRKGELTSAEMHALEKKALQDPFLADALEGAESVSSENFSADLDELRESINYQSEERRVASFERASAASTSAPMMQAAKQVVPSQPKVVSKWFWPLRLAASLLIMFGVFWMANQLIPQGGKETLALKKEEPKAEPTSPTASQANDSVAAVQKAITSSQPKSIAEKPKQLAVNKPIETVSSGSGVVASAVVEAEEKQTALLDVSKNKATLREETVEDKKAKEVVAEMDEKVSLVEPFAPAMKKDISSYASRSQESRKKSSPVQLVQGQVLSAEDGTPLLGVNVLVQGTTIGTTTDVNGNYQLASDGNQKLVFSFIGFQTQEVVVADQQKINVKLGLDETQLSEVVVMGAAPRDDVDRVPIIKLAEPVGGRKAYDKYLNNNVHYPAEALASKVKGKVTVKFTVKTNGALDDFSVVKSIGHGCDEEVIRLVKEGPAWSPTTEDNVAVESEVLVKVKFDPAKTKK